MIDPLEHGAQQRDIRLEDRDDARALHPARQRAHVVPGAEPHDRDRRGRRHVHRVGDLLRLAERPAPARQGPRRPRAADPLHAQRPVVGAKEPQVRSGRTVTDKLGGPAGSTRQGRQVPLENARVGRRRTARAGDGRALTERVGEDVRIQRKRRHGSLPVSTGRRRLAPECRGNRSFARTPARGNHARTLGAVISTRSATKGAILKMGPTTSLASALLARSAPVLAEIPDALRETGVLRIWVLERPLPLTIAVAAAGALAWFILRSRGKPREANAAGRILVALAGLVFAAGAAVRTEQETLKARVREVVAAVAKADSTAVAGFLTDDAYVVPFGFQRDAIITKMESTLGRAITIKEHRVRSIRAVLDSPASARTQFRVHVVADGALYAGPVGSWWMLRWRKDPSGQWKVAEIEMQQLDGADVQSLRP
jgi:ketosteroid isomerase-like protein